MDDLHDLARYIVGRPWLRWMAGMRMVSHASGAAFRWVEEPRSMRAVMVRRGYQVMIGPSAIDAPDISDPATVGCLWALAEEVCGGPVNVLVANYVAGCARWEAQADQGDEFGYGHTRAEALIALMDSAHAAQGGQDEQ